MGNIDRKIDYRELYWLGTESLGRRPKAIEGSEDFALGLITIGVDSGNITDFREYWNGMGCYTFLCICNHPSISVCIWSAYGCYSKSHTTTQCSLFKRD